MVSQPKRAIRRAVILIGLLLLLVTSAASQTNRRPWLRGVWEGTGYQNDDNSTWTMKVTVKRLKGGRRAFSIDYPSLQCGGRWELLSMTRSRATFRELLDRGQDKCSDKGLVTIQKIGRQLIFLYANEGSRKITASAVLNRKMAATTQSTGQ
jgi:hypothetical protein